MLRPIIWLATVALIVLGASACTARAGDEGESQDLRALARVRHTPDYAAEESLIPLPIPPQRSIAPQSRLQCPCS